MRVDVLAVAVVAVLAFAVPTAAMTTGGNADAVGEAVELAPHPGPNGDYASIQNGELQVDFDRLNDEAVTTADDVVSVSVTGEEPVVLTVESDEPGVAAYTGSGQPIGPANPVQIPAGDTLALGFRLDTLGPNPGDATITVTARPPDEDDAVPIVGRDEEEDEQEPVMEPRSAEVLFPEGTPGADGVSVEWLDSMPGEHPPFEPEAVIDPDATARGGHGLRLVDGQLVTDVGRTVTLTARHSYIGEAEAVARDLQVSAILDITPAPDRRDQYATVRIQIPRDRLDSPDEAAVVRHTDRGWQVLATEVVEVTDRSVLLEAETPGFSTFAVFARSDVDYEWTLPDGSRTSGPQLQTAFDEPGAYNVSLRVTDALGRSDSTQRTVIANDRPTVRIEGAAAAGGGEPTTLRANVTNVVGSTTVTWRLPNGSTAEGRNVTGAFESGDVVEATVEDAFGATGSADAVIGAGGAGAQGPIAGIDFLPTGLPWWVLLALALAAVALAARLAQSEIYPLIGEIGEDSLDALRRLIERLTSDTPRITVVDDPRWNPAEDRVEIGRLAVEAPSGFLKAIEITITDGTGAQVIQQTIDPAGEATFDESPVTIPVFGGVEPVAEGTYSVEIRAIDEFDQVGVVGQTHDLVTGQPTPS